MFEILLCDDDKSFFVFIGPIGLVTLLAARSAGASQIAITGEIFICVFPLFI